MGNGRISTAPLVAGDASSDAVIDAVSALLVALDEQGRVTLWNRATAELTGWSAADAMGLEVEELFGPCPRLGAAIHAARGGKRREVSSSMLTRATAPARIRWQVTPLPRRSVGAVLLSGVDITAQAALEARAADAELMAAMGRLTASLAHEIKNPLNSASLQLEVLRRAAARRDDANGMLDGLEKAQAELRRLTRLLDDFMGLARPHQLVRRPTDLAATLWDVASLHELAAAEAGVTIRVVAAEVPSLLADEARLRQALLDLVANAIEALRERGGGEVVLRLEDHGHELVIAVADDGPGLPQPSGELLRPFVTTKPSGTGLGLPIVRKIVELHGGALAIGAREGGGTEATLTLPVGPG